MKRFNHDFWLRVGFGIFLVIWGWDRAYRAESWATEGLMGHFYGDIGLIVNAIRLLGIVQLLLAASFFTNYLVKYSAVILMAMLIVSTAITLRPMFEYLINGGNPVPAIIFADHFPLIAGAWAIFAHATNRK